MADQEGSVYACVATHPHHAADLTAAGVAELRELASHPKVVGIGETGLDFYRNRAPRAAQESAFRAQLRLAEELALPVVIHDREAHAETLRILAEDAGRLSAVVLHCFGGDRTVASEAWKRGYFVGVGGPVTYPNADGLREVLAQAPRDRVVLETDAPYLPPTPHRGKRNEPAYLRLVAERVATLWGDTLEGVAATTTRNAYRAFGLPDAGAAV